MTLYTSQNPRAEQTNQQLTVRLDLHGTVKLRMRQLDTVRSTCSSMLTCTEFLDWRSTPPLLIVLASLIINPVLPARDIVLQQKNLPDYLVRRKSIHGIRNINLTNTEH